MADIEITPEMLAAAWKAWHARHGGKLGPGPAFREAIEAVIPIIAKAAKAEMRERCADVAACHADDRPRRYEMDWNDGYMDGCAGAAAAIRAMEV